MKTLICKDFPDYAIKVRQTVFVDEQGFHDEFDDIDKTAVHFVMLNEDEAPIATCRLFWSSEMESYILGRLAVVKEYRGRDIGTVMVKEAENYVRKEAGNSIALHAQCRVTGFYKKLGFVEFGDIEEEEGCPHVWMKKIIQ